MKQCTKCKQWKDESEFSKSSRYKDHLCYWCRNCKSIDRKEWHKKNKERENKNNREWQKEHNWNTYINREKYIKSENGRIAKKKGQAKWILQNLEKFKMMKKKAHIKNKAKRRGMKDILLWNNPFPREIAIDFHHINNFFIVPIPRKIHNFTNKRNVKEHREENANWIEKLYCININKIMEV